MADTRTETPADEMRWASSLLLQRVADFRAEEHEPYWSGGFFQGIDNACGGAGGALAGLFTPEAAEGLAGWLHRTARQWDHEVRVQDDGRYHRECDGVVGEDCVCFAGALATVRAFTGGTS
jgi:hypothetical protein